MSRPRYAIYYTPPPESRFAHFGASLLGYDPFEGVDVEHPQCDGLAADVIAGFTEEPRRYGFHATLVAPFRLKDASESDLIGALTGFARDCQPIEIGALKIVRMGNFLALRPEQEDIPALEGLESGLVRLFDDYRAAPTDADKARRFAAHLSPRQRELFTRWGYPFVFDQFRFHMTLTGPLSLSDMAKVQPAIANLFGAVAQTHVEIDALSLMRQERPDARFTVVSRVALKGKGR